MPTPLPTLTHRLLRVGTPTDIREAVLVLATAAAHGRRLNPVVRAALAELATAEERVIVLDASAYEALS